MCPATDHARAAVLALSQWAHDAALTARQYAEVLQAFDQVLGVIARNLEIVVRRCEEVHGDERPEEDRSGHA